MSGHFILQMMVCKAMSRAVESAQKGMTLECATPTTATETYHAQGQEIGATVVFNGFDANSRFTCDDKPISAEHASNLINKHIASL